MSSEDPGTERVLYRTICRMDETHRQRLGPEAGRIARPTLRRVNFSSGAGLRARRWSPEACAAGWDARATVSLKLLANEASVSSSWPVGRASVPAGGHPRHAPRAGTPAPLLASTSWPVGRASVPAGGRPRLAPRSGTPAPLLASSSWSVGRASVPAGGRPRHAPRSGTPAPLISLNLLASGAGLRARRPVAPRLRPSVTESVG
jgi:hypothetical protein